MHQAKEKTDKELRKFGFVVGGVFFVLGSLLIWRERVLGPYLLALGIALLLPAVVMPRSLRLVEKYWMAFAEVLGGFMTRVILAIVFFFIVTPIALLGRLVRRDILCLKLDRSAPTYWVPTEVDGPGTRPYDPY